MCSKSLVPILICEWPRPRPPSLFMQSSNRSRASSNAERASNMPWSAATLLCPGFSHLSGKLSTKLLAHTPTEGPYFALALKLFLCTCVSLLLGYILIPGGISVGLSRYWWTWCLTHMRYLYLSIWSAVAPAWKCRLCSLYESIHFLPFLLTCTHARRSCAISRQRKVNRRIRRAGMSSRNVLCQWKFREPSQNNIFRNSCRCLLQLFKIS